MEPITKTDFLLNDPEISIIDDINIDVEIGHLLHLKQDYMNYLKKSLSKQSLSKKSLNYILNIDGTSDEFFTINCIASKTTKLNPTINIYDQQTDHENILVLDIYDHILQKLVMRKKLILPKTVEINNELDAIYKYLHQSNLVIKIKSLFNKINNLNSTDDDSTIQENGIYYTKDTITQLIASYKEEFNNLKQSYDQFLKRKYFMLNYKAQLYNTFKLKMNTLKQLEIAVSIKYFKKFFDIMSIDPNNNKDKVKQYLKLQSELNTLCGFNVKPDVNKIFKFITKEKTFFGRLLDIKKHADSSSIYVIKPLLSTEILEINKNLVLEIGLRETQINLYNHFNNNFISTNKILEFYDMPIIKPKIMIEKYFQGNLYNPTDSIIVEDSEQDVVDTSIHIKNDILKKVINLSDQHIHLYNKLGDILTLSNASSFFPGKGPNEFLINTTVENQSFINLSMITNWRKKLTNNYINYKITDNGQYIVPIFIDGLMFASVNHYHHYRLFSDSNYSGGVKTQYDEYANQFTLTNNGICSRISGKELNAIKHKLPFISGWTSEYSNVLKKSLYAKFIQNTELQNIIRYTEESLLLYPTKSSEDDLYQAQYELMEIRYIILNSMSIDFYDNAINDKELFKKWSVEKGTTAPEITKLADVILFKIEQLKHTLQNQHISIESNNNISTSFEQLVNIISKKKLYIKEVPVNGDSLFHSIIYGLYDQNINPMNKDIIEHQFSKHVTFINVRTIEECFQPMFIQAVQELRIQISNKLRENITNNDPYVNAIKTYILERDTLDNYLEHMKLMASDKGIWGSIIEVQVAAALLNVNIIIYKDDDTQYIYSASDMRRIFNKGFEYNTILEATSIPTIILGYIGNRHYVLLKNISVRQSETIGYDKKDIVVIDIVDDKTTYPVATLLTDDSIIPIGIFDNETYKINTDIDSSLANRLENNLIQYWETTDIDIYTNKAIRIVTYWINKSTNHIYHEKYFLKPIGTFSIEQADGQSYSNFLFD